MTSSVYSVNWERRCLYLVLLPYVLSFTLPDDNTWCHRVTGYYTGHNRPSGDAKVVDAVDLEIAINHGHRVAPHPGRRSLMPKADRCIADVLFQRCPFQFARQDLLLQKWTQQIEIAYCSTEFRAF